MAAGAALAAKRGEKSKSSLRGASKSMAKSMNEGQLEELASVKRKKLPTRKRSKTASARKSTSSKSRTRTNASKTKTSARKRS